MIARAAAGTPPQATGSKCVTVVENNRAGYRNHAWGGGWNTPKATRTGFKVCNFLQKLFSQDSMHSFFCTERKRWSNGLCNDKTMTLRECLQSGTCAVATNRHRHRTASCATGCTDEVAICLTYECATGCTMTDEPTDLQPAASAFAASASKQKLSVLHTISHCAGTFRLYIAAKGVGPLADLQRL